MKLGYRTCDNCGSRLAPFFPRKRGSDGESLLCAACKDRDDLVVAALAEMEPMEALELVESIHKAVIAPAYAGPILVEHSEMFDTWVVSQADQRTYGVFDTEEEARAFADTIVIEGVRKQAHDSGDGETIYHCPFCGAGGVMGRSDGTAECQFCGTSFTVQVQPSMPSMPQTVDGQPYHNPEMPGEETAPGEAVPGEEEAPFETGVEGEDVANPNPFTDGAPKAKPNPFAAILRPEFITRQGNMLSEEDYIKHLALAYADDREAVLAALREK